MASTRNLQASAGWVLPVLNYQPINISGDEPGLSAANLTKQVILGPPFKWPWNRSEVALNLIPAALTATPPVLAQQDYLAALPNMGFIERALLVDTKGVVMEIEVKQGLPTASQVQRPSAVAIQTDDGMGGLTIRVNTLPDQAYRLILQYQRKAIPMSSMAATWAPLPDELAFVYDWLFLAHCSLITKDGRFPIFAQRGIAHLLGVAEGLSELDRNLFMGNWLQILTAPQRAQMLTQQGISGRQQ